MLGSMLYFAGVEGDAGQLGAAEGDGAAGEEGEEVFAGVGTGGGLADDADDLVEGVKGDLVAEENVLAVTGLGEEVCGAAADDVLAMIEEGADGVVERELLGLAVVDGEENHGEGFLHLGVFVELVEDDLVLGAALEADVDAHAVTVGLVAKFVAGDVGDDALGDELGDALHELGFIDLVGDLVDDDGFTAAGNLFDFGFAADDEATSAGAVGVGDLGAAENDAAGGEIGAEDVVERDGEVGADLVRPPW